MLKADRLSESKTILNFIFFLLIVFSTQNVLAANTIMGVVYDRLRAPLSGVEVELLDEYYRLLRRVRTDSIGRYQFGGLNNGNYTIRVLPFQYDLQDQSQYIELQAISARPGEQGSTFITQDFYLQPKKGGLAETEIGLVFAQDIPQAAKKIYDKALKDLASKRTTEGILGLNEAVKLFPNFYLALHRIGKELFKIKKYQEAVPFLIKAAEINPKSATSFYYLGYALYNLGKEYNKSAITSLNQAQILAPSSTQVLYVLGKVERSAGKYDDAEKHLLQAKKLSKVSIPEIHKELAQLYADNLKKYKEAADELELYLRASRLSRQDEEKTKKIISDLRKKAV